MGLFCNGLPFDYTFHEYKKVVSNADGLSQFSIDDYKLTLQLIFNIIKKYNYLFSLAILSNLFESPFGQWELLDITPVESKFS